MHFAYTVSSTATEWPARAATSVGGTPAFSHVDTGWGILGTDGATDLIAAIEPDRWPEIAEYDQEQLDDLLGRIHRWERDIDPAGQRLPRAKRHDDKTLAVVPQIFRLDPWATLGK